MNDDGEYHATTTTITTNDNKNNDNDDYNNRNTLIRQVGLIYETVNVSGIMFAVVHIHIATGGSIWFWETGGEKWINYEH